MGEGVGPLLANGQAKNSNYAAARFPLIAPALSAENAVTSLSSLLIQAVDFARIGVRTVPKSAALSL